MLILTTITLICGFVRIEQGSSTYGVGAVTYSFYVCVLNYNVLVQFKNIFMPNIV